MSSVEVAYFFKIIKIVLVSYFILWYNNNITDIDKKYFIIRKTEWGHQKSTFEIMKDRPFNMTDATRNILAYDQLNDNKKTTYHLLEVSSDITDEVKKNSNGEGKQLSLF